MVNWLIILLFAVGLVSASALLHATPTGDANRGKSLFIRYCQACHGVQGKGDGYIMFSPPVADLSAPRVQTKPDAELAKLIHDGRSNTAMGSWRLVLSQEEIRDVVAYIRTLKK